MENASNAFFCHFIILLLWWHNQVMTFVSTAKEEGKLFVKEINRMPQISSLLNGFFGMPLPCSLVHFTLNLGST